MNNTLLKGFRLLEALACHAEPMGVTELALAVNMPKSGVHRLLQALVSAQYVETVGTGRYRVSTKLWGIASAALPGFELRRRAVALMAVMARETLESVHLSVLHERDVVYVHKVDAHGVAHTYSQIGERAPAHCVATGKAMMAYKGIDWLRGAVRDLPAFTPNTITEPNAFLSNMAKIRERGYAENHEEWRAGFAGLAAPIFDQSAHVIGAIGVSGPSDRILETGTEWLVRKVVEAGQALSSQPNRPAGHTLLMAITQHWATPRDERDISVDIATY